MKSYVQNLDDATVCGTTNPTKVDNIRAAPLTVTDAIKQFGITVADYNLNQLSEGYKNARICMDDDFSKISDPDKAALAGTSNYKTLL